MFRLFALLIILTAPIAVLSPYAVAAPAEDSGGESTSNRTLELSGLVVPVERDGKLINYLFVNARVIIEDGFDHWEVREAAHVYRDRILKEVHRNPVGAADSPMKVDLAKFDAAVRKVFGDLLDEKAVKSVEVLSADSQKVFIGG